MPPRCKFCAHDNRGAFESAVLGRSETYRNVAKQGGFSPACVVRHMRQHVSKSLAKAQETVEKAVVREVVRRQRARSIQELDLYGDLARIHAVGQKLMDACDQFLTHPDRPDEYTLDPRAHELEVIYLEEVGTKRNGDPIVVPKAGTVQELLARLAGHWEPLSVKWKVSDPRRLALQTAAYIGKNVGIITSILANRPPEGEEEQIAKSPAWARFARKVAEALRPFPDARKAFLEACRELDREPRE